MTPEILQILSAGLAGTAFAVIFHIRPKQLPVAFIGSALSWALYLLAWNVWESRGVVMMFAAAGVTVFSEIAARIVRMPVSVIYTPAIIPLIPGGNLYYSICGFVSNSHADFVKFGALLLEDTLGIVLGSIIILSFVSAVTSKRKKA